MRRVISIFAAALMLAALWACGGGEEPVSTFSTATQDILTTEESMTESLPPVTVIDETDQIVVRLFSPDSKEILPLRELRQKIMVEEWKTFDEDEANLRLSDTRRLCVRVMEDFKDKDELWRLQYAYKEIVLIDESTGKETVLLQGNGKSGYFERKEPYVASIIDERYFIYLVTSQESGIYDLEKMKRYPTKRTGDIFGTVNGSLYYWDVTGECFDGHCLWKTDISMLDEDNLLQVINVLEGLDFGIDLLYQAEISPDEKYYVLRGIWEIAIIDLEKRVEIYRLEEKYAAKTGTIWFENSDTLYADTQYGLIEIKIK